MHWPDREIERPRPEMVHESSGISQSAFLLPGIRHDGATAFLASIKLLEIPLGLMIGKMLAGEDQHEAKPMSRNLIGAESFSDRQCTSPWFRHSRMVQIGA
jgi:hypothetical protein